MCIEKCNFSFCPCGENRSYKKNKIGLKSITDSAYGYVFQVPYVYHQECLDRVLKNPRYYTNKEVDLAIEILDSIEEKKNKVLNWEQKRNKIRNVK